ncbi:protein odr-4 homolog [Macrobrachium nipponense]|uniref:protein odr-4 homolog n=1 Tax=Macrobrachium nipponense TaxID=159736 RepID=UPI0030C7C0FF
MVKTILAEDSLQDKLTSLAKNGAFQIGLLIGQCSPEKDFIAHLAPTPTIDEGDLSSEEDEEAVSKSDQIRSKAPDSIAKIVDAVLAQHTRQVVRMLPGGLDIIGIYVVTPQSDFTASANQSKLRSILGAVHRTASKILLGTVESTAEKCILHVCTQTLKIVCKSQEVSTTAPSVMSTVDLKFQRGGVRWQQLSYTYNINLNFWLPKDKSTQSLYKMVLTYIKPWADSVSSSLILIDSELPDDSDLLDPEAEEKPTKKKGGRGVMELTPPKVFNVEILDSCVPSTNSDGKLESSGSLRLIGALAGLAFVHSKATVGEARAAVLVDLVRSVVSRWEMHCDSLIEEPPSHLIGPIIHEPPRRVFLEGGGLPVSLCDYLFPGDTSADACQSAQELLGVKVRDEHVDDTLETFKEVETEEDVVPGEEEIREHGSTIRSGPGSCPVAYVMLAVAVGIVGLGLSYVTLQGDKMVT